MAEYQAAPATPADFPGKTLGIVGLVLAIFMNVVGLIISIVARNQSKAAGFPNTPAKAGIIVGIITTVLAIIYVIVIVVAMGSGLAQVPR